MNSEPSSQTPTKSGESDASSQNEDRVDGPRFMASLLSLCLIGVVAGALTAGLLTALLIYSPLSVFPSTNDSTADPLACTTNDCKYLAQWLRVKIDRKVDPCHDFYKFVCDDYKDYNSLNKVTFEVMRIAQSAAHATTVPATGQTAWQKATALFKACLTMVDSKRDETKELTEWMTSLGLDLRNLTSSEPFDPVDMVVRCSLDFGIPVLLSFTFENVTFVNKKRLMILNINIDEAKWLEYLQEALKTSEEDINASTMKTLQKYGVPRSRLQGLSSDINKYGTKLISIGESMQSNPAVATIVTGPIQDLGKVTQPTITGEMWAALIAKYTKNTYQGSDVIIYQVFSPLFLAKALESAEVGSHGMRCYIAWSLFRQLVKYTDPDLLVKDKKPQDVCYERANRLMGYAITSRYFHSVISKKTILKVKEMASNIRKAFQGAFQSSSWMTGSVREAALRKITNMRHHIGAIGAMLDDAYVDKYYASFPDLPTDRFFKAWREAAAAAIHQTWADATMMLHRETEANAFYTGQFNTLLIQASILLPNLLFTEGPAAFNYGSFGRIIGHEMMHGYDVNGSQYDENGKLSPWLSPESTMHYVNSTLCLRHMHKDVLERRQEVLNETIDSENIADLGGTTMAYSAFTSLPPSKRDATLPGVAMTANQLFFVGHCTPWCEKQTTDSPLWLTGYDRYPPGRSRCIVPLMNMPEFSDAFHCKKGSYMNPPNKCTFWS